MTPASEIARLASTRIGQQYVLGSRARYDDPDYRGPWDCAELATWAVRQVTGALVGVSAAGDAYSGAWAEAGGRPAIVLPDPLPSDAVRWTAPRAIHPEVAAGTPGAILVRAPSAPGASGHVAIVSSSSGATVEAYDTAHGVIASSAVGRRWTCGIVVPGVEYVLRRISLSSPAVLRIGAQGEVVRRIQVALAAAGHDPGAADGAFGPRTHAAVVSFQRAKHLVPDGEVGPRTAAALGISL